MRRPENVTPVFAGTRVALIDADSATGDGATTVGVGVGVGASVGVGVGVGVGLGDTAADGVGLACGPVGPTPPVPALPRGAGEPFGAAMGFGDEVVIPAVPPIEPVATGVGFFLVVAETAER